MHNNFMEENIKNDLLASCATMFTKWSQGKGTRRLYGPNKPQVTAVLLELLQIINSILLVVKKFAIVKKKEDLVVAMDDFVVEGRSLTPMSVFESVLSLKEDFERLNLNSITFYGQLSSYELEEMFEAMNKPLKFLESEGGLKKFLKEKKVEHIEVDQFQVKILKTGEEITTEPHKNKEAFKLAKKVERKLFSSTWQEYLSGKLDKDKFKTDYDSFLKLATTKPQDLVKVLKRILSRQEKVEAFLANLEEKLFAVGFSQDAIEEIKKKLLKPKKVMVEEDELARLRKIEKDFQRSLQERVNQSLKEVNRIKKKLAERKERTDAILRQVNQGALTLDKKGRIISLNPIAEKVLGLSIKECKGKSLEEVISRSHIVSIVPDWQKENEEETPKTVKVFSADNDVLDAVAESSLVIEDENGESIGTITAPPQEVLKKEFEKRTNDILDVLGHDLRAPLAAIKQNFSLIVSDDIRKHLNPAQEKFVGFCKKSMERMEKLISKILDASRLEKGKIILKKETVDTNKFLEDCVLSLKTWAEEKGITLTLIADKLPSLVIDPERIYQVISNLISNALKFTPSGGSVKVEARLKKEEGEDKIIISVSDTGIGIKKEDLPRIFNKYEQVNLNSGAGRSGLGLGLNICKSIVTLHKGKIWAESEEGKGSIFSFVLPIEQEKEEEND